MPQLSPDQLHDCLERAGVEAVYPRQPRDLLPLLSLLREINAELAKDGGQAGTHAYEMMAAVEEINAGNTAVLIELIAATVMMKRAENQLPKQLSVTFSPSDIDEMQRLFRMDATRHGMQLTVTLTAREHIAPSWRADDEELPAGALPQAEAADAPERPIWAVRAGCGLLVEYDARQAAEKALSAAHAVDLLARVENRYCLHEDCPTTGCNHAEATSDA